MSALGPASLPAWAGLLAAASTLLAASSAEACSPWAERVVAWDARADVVVVAIWMERDKVPAPGASARPDQYELRRLSTGRGLASHSCPDPAGEAVTRDQPACDWQTAFSRSIPGGAAWGRRGPALPAGRVRVRATRPDAATQEFALEARGPRGWRRVLWLDRVAEGYPERRRYDIETSERTGGQVVLALRYHSRGGNCSHTAVQVFALDGRDLDDPTHPGRHARLVSRVREDRPFGHWRSVAELGPLPPARLIEAMEVAETAGQPALGVAWWRAATAGMPAVERQALERSLRSHPGLHRVREELARRL
jgi:hypothetical protein